MKRSLLSLLLISLLFLPLFSVRANLSFSSAQLQEEEVHLLLGGDIHTSRTVYLNQDQEIEVCYENVKIVQIVKPKNSSKLQLSVLKEGEAVWKGKLGDWHLTVVASDGTVYRSRGLYCLPKGEIVITDETPVPVYLVGVFPDLYQWLSREGPIWRHIWWIEITEEG